MTAAEIASRTIRTRLLRNIVIMALVAFIAGAAGAALGATLFAAPGDHASSGMHALVHEGLDLSAEQERALDAIEERFAARRREVESELTAANRALADVIAENPDYAPEVGDAVGRVHQVMGELQVATVLHVYEMRAILTEEQAALFDQRVSRALMGAAE